MRKSIARDVLREQHEGRRETAKKIWEIYVDEVKRLLENPDETPDTSVLEKFIENEDGAFGKQLAKVFAEDIVRGHHRAKQVAEEKAIPGVVCLADVEVIPDLWEFWDHFEQMLTRHEWERFDREMEPEFDRLMEKHPDKLRKLYAIRRNLMIRRERWASAERW